MLNLQNGMPLDPETVPSTSSRVTEIPAPLPAPLPRLPADSNST